VNENTQAIFSALTEDPSGAIWIIAALNLLTIVCGVRTDLWRSRLLKLLVFVQLLIVPIVALIGFNYAIRPPA
jgi:hypothetical protein